MKKTAIISPCGRYRYRLTRGEGRLMPVVMLNPSTADADVDDPTIRRLLGFAKGVRIESRSVSNIERFDGIDVVNLYALRATDPAEIRRAKNPYGQDNRYHLHEFFQAHGDNVICAWGANATPEACSMLMEIASCYVHPDNLLSCFGTNKNGSPKHPLYLPKTAKLSPYWWRAQP